jgi:uncharacterized protein YraI
MIASRKKRHGFRLVSLIVLSLFLSGFLFVFTPTSALAQEDSPFGPDVVTATTTFNLHLREGPGTEHPILATLPQGTVVGFTGFTDDTGDWVQVESADGHVGWVAAQFLSNVPDGLQDHNADLPAAEPAAEAPEESPFGADVVTATTTVNLRLREGPGAEHPILEVLPLGTIVGFTGLTDETGDWVQVDSADRPVGWVAAQFLSNVPGGLQVPSADAPAAEPVAEPAAEAPEESPFGADVVTSTTTFNLYLREGPGTEHPILTTLPQGTVVGFTGLTDETGDWVQVDSGDGQVGWVAAQFLSNVPSDLQVWVAES